MTELSPSSAISTQWKSLADKTCKSDQIKINALNPEAFAALKKYVGADNLVFDYGCGWGDYADLLVRNNYRVEAFDAADEMVAHSKKQYSQPTFMYKSELEAQAQTMNQRYDAVVSNLVLCILSQKEQSKMLGEIKTILKDDGVIIMSFCHPCFDYLPDSLVSRRTAPESALYAQEFKYKKVIKENGLEFDDYHRSLTYYSQLFEQHGLQICEISESNSLSTSQYPDFIIFVLRKKPSN